MKQFLSGLFIGLFAALWFGERRRRIKATRPARSLETLSEAYAANPHPHKELHVIPRDGLSTYANAIANELIRADLSEAEVHDVREYIRKLILDATTYYGTLDRMENQQRDLLDEIIDQEMRRHD
jgi:hypothetical protein